MRGRSRPRPVRSELEDPEALAADHLAGAVTALRAGDGEGFVDIELRAMNELGEHVSGTAVLTLPTRTRS